MIRWRRNGQGGAATPRAAAYLTAGARASTDDTARAALDETGGSIVNDKVAEGADGQVYEFGAMRDDRRTVESRRPPGVTARHRRPGAHGGSTALANLASAGVTAKCEDGGRETSHQARTADHPLDGFRGGCNDRGEGVDECQRGRGAAGGQQEGVGESLVATVVREESLPGRHLTEGRGGIDRSDASVTSERLE